ncbi:MAG: hypothetical protein DHS20C14_10000 [Phycisphaeraceae bacterium]|nr:MAG: hypothetical protein DHS20C14_10000 [Phycisphaeraceae bacterium]
MADERWDTGIDYDDRPSGGSSPFRNAIRRVFGDGENPLTWGFPLYSAWGIQVKMHLALAVFIAARLIWSLDPDNIGFGLMVPMLVALFVLVLAHEYGHCIACRWTGGEADEIMLWPLGGLASCRPPEHWKDDLVTTVGGPAVNALLLAPLGLAVYFTTWSTSAVLINPLDPGYYLGMTEITSSWVKLWIWSFYYMNLVLLLFNTLVPMFPMDAGRVLQALLWRRQGRDKSLYTAATVGLAVAVALAVVGMIFETLTLVLVALFCGLTCYTERRRLRLLATGWDGVMAPPGMGPETPPDPELARIERESEAQAELDRILAKISTEGLAALSGAERRTLKRATRRGREA